MNLQAENVFFNRNSVCSPTNVGNCQKMNGLLDTGRLKWRSVVMYPEKINHRQYTVKKLECLSHKSLTFSSKTFDIIYLRQVSE